MEYHYATKEGALILKEYKKGLEVVSYEGEDIYLTIPGTVAGKEGTEGKAVISVGKKAMLSCKSLRRVELPQTIEEVGDWAFAYCDSLRELSLPGKEIRFGKGIFRECGKVRFVTVEGKHRDIGALLAAAVTLLDAPYLFTPVGCGEEDWLRQWDARMLQILRAADRDGYSKMVLCGEEDYGSKENNLDYFLNQKRKSKVRIAFMRLLYPVGLQSGVKEELENYLREHTAGSGFSAGYVPESKNGTVIVSSGGSASGNRRAADNGSAYGALSGRENADVWDETWQVLLEEHGEDSEYYKLFTKIGCLTEENFDKILSEAGENFPEMKAWFLKYKEETIGYTDFFADLML